MPEEEIQMSDIKCSCATSTPSIEIRYSNELSNQSSNVSLKQSQRTKKLQQSKLHNNLKLAAADLMALWTPVAICLLLASAKTLIRNFGRHDDFESVRAVGESPLLEAEVELNAERVALSNSDVFTKTSLLLAVCLIAVVAIVVATFIVVMLLKNNCFLCLKGYITIAFVSLGVHFSIFWFYTAANALKFPIDWITMTILTFNFLVLIAISIGFAKAAPRCLVQVVHVILCATVAYIIANLILGGSFAYASVLCGAVSLWDLFAVLCPRGPLNRIIQMAEGQSGVTDFLQSLVYTAAVWTATVVVTAKPEKPLRRGSRLGLGDFIFYGILAAAATKECGPAGGLACYLALKFGFCLTLVSLKLRRRALPALPLPVAVAITTVGLLKGSGLAYSAVLAERQLML